MTDPAACRSAASCFSGASAPPSDPRDVVILPPRSRPAPQLVDAEVTANDRVGDRYWRVRLRAPTIAASVEPGQFCMLTVTRTARQGPVLPRPMAVYDTDPAMGVIDVVYSVAGSGTRALSSFAVGECVTTVGPLGQGFDLPGSGRLLLLGRGIGTCSLTMLAAQAVPRGLPVTAVTSGRHADAVIGADFYTDLGIDVLDVVDTDGSSDPARLGRRLTAALDEDPPTLVAVCGSRRLERLATELAAHWLTPIQVALEAHMACGLGYCHGCSTGDRSAAQEAPLVCRDGPVFAIRHDTAGQQPGGRLGGTGGSARPARTV